ncbi:MAG: 2-octaprenylphenol hydroxylase [Gammaproteobacteria bacterium]|nr:2-octaprenylphenol hydroxylase [Gammaproteobacteria bacterium]
MNSAATGRSIGGTGVGRTAAGRDFDLLIVGTGITGTAMASLAVARKLAAPGRVAVIGRQPSSPPGAPDAESDWDLRVFALSRASQRLLQACGAWQHLPPEKMASFERMRVWDSHGEPQGTGSLSFDCAEIGEPNLGFIVEGHALQTQCRRAASAAGAVFVEAEIEGIAVGDTGVRVRLNDGRDLQGQLLIAADGADSRARALLGIETAGHAYHQDALVAHVRTAKPHGNTAWQRFLPSGPLAFLPLPDGRVSIVWSVPRAEATRLRALDPTAFGAELGAASGEVLGTCELTTRVSSFPLALQYALDYARPRAVLVGDAAHTVHPLAGQGLNLGLLDCASLAEVLSGGSRDPGGAGFLGEHRLLRRYERWRKAENLLAATALDGLERLFSSDRRALSRLRLAGLGGISHMPFIKRRLALRALGLSGDVPAFLKSEPAPRG